MVLKCFLPSFFGVALLLVGGCSTLTPASTAKPAAKPARAPRPPKVLFEAQFAPGKWSAADWDMVKSWRWDYAGDWIQKPDCIENKVPADATKEEMLNKRAGETYTAMILKKKFKGNLTVSCKMGFDHRMAPGIIIAAEPVKDSKGRLEFREHFEIILYDQGLNVWHHYFENGKQQWVKKHYLFADNAYVPGKMHDLTVKLSYTRKGPFIELIAGERKIGYWEPALMKGEYRIGLVASEGVNSFRDFKVTTP